MAFANLFTRLTAVEDAVGSPGQPRGPAPPRRNEPGSGTRKRRFQGEQRGPHDKKLCYQTLTARTSIAAAADYKAVRREMHHTQSEHTPVGVPTEVIRDHHDKDGSNNKRHKALSCKSKNNCNVNKRQEQQKKMDGQKYQQQQKGRRRSAGRGGGHQATRTRRGRGDWKDLNQDIRVKQTRFMTQEFKDQNAVMVDGRLLCRHFLWGRCIKGDKCQLEHVKGYNDLIKELCKFYVVGFCTKGENCPYMHSSFPCKFFHKKGKCSQGAVCRFSHEPLNDVTSKLLDEALKWENDLYELTRKANQESSGQPENPSEITETDQTPDKSLQPLQLNFYRSAEPNAEKEASCHPTEELVDTAEEAVPAQASDAAKPHSPPSADSNTPEPICYSVEAVLGPQLSRPFSNSVTASRNKEFTPLASSDRTSDSANQTPVPYSVDAVLGSYKSVEESSYGQTPTLTAETVSYTPKLYFEENDFYSVDTAKTESQEKSLPPLQVHTDLSSKSCADLPQTSAGLQNRGDTSETSKPAQRASHEVKLDVLSTDTRCSINSTSEAAPAFGPMKQKSIFSKPQSHTQTSIQPTQSKPHLSVLTPDSQASLKPFRPSPRCTQSRPSESSDSANSVSRQHPTEIQLESKETPSGLSLGSQIQCSNESATDCGSLVSHCGDLAAGSEKTPKRPFHSLFASPITGTLQPKDKSVNSSCPSGPDQSSSPAPPSADCRGNKGSAGSFLSLFAAPLPSSQQSVQSVDNPKHSNLEVPPSKQARIAPTSPNLSPKPTTVTNSSPERMNQPAEQLVTPAGPAASGDSPSTSHTRKQLPHVSSHRGTAEAGAASSILKTLFVCLSPYQEDGEPQHRVQIGGPSEGEKKDKNSTQSVARQQKMKKGGRLKKLKTEDTHKESSEKTVADSRQNKSSLPTPQICSEATAADPAPSNPGLTEPQVRDAGTRNLPLKPVVPLMQHHVQPRPKNTSGGPKSLNATVAATPIRNLFKTLDTTVLHVGNERCNYV